MRFYLRNICLSCSDGRLSQRKFNVYFPIFSLLNLSFEQELFCILCHNQDFDQFLLQKVALLHDLTKNLSDFHLITGLLTIFFNITNYFCLLFTVRFFTIFLHELGQAFLKMNLLPPSNFQNLNQVLRKMTNAFGIIYCFY